MRWLEERYTVYGNAEVVVTQTGGYRTLEILMKRVSRWIACQRMQTHLCNAGRGSALMYLLYSIQQHSTASFADAEGPIPSMISSAANSVAFVWSATDVAYGANAVITNPSLGFHKEVEGERRRCHRSGPLECDEVLRTAR